MGKILTLSFDDTKVFKKIIMTGESILNEIKFEADNNGLRFRGLDGGHTCFFRVEFSDEYFIEYSLDNPLSIIVDTGELLKVTKRMKNDDCLKIIMTEDHMIFEADNGSNQKEFKIYAVDNEYDSPDLPDIDFPVSIDSVILNDLKDILGDAELYNEAFTIQTINDSIQIDTHGMLGEYKAKVVDINFKKMFSSKFKIELISKFFKLNGVAEELCLKMGDTMPLMLSIHEDNLKIDYMVAPRIDEED